MTAASFSCAANRATFLALALNQSRLIAVSRLLLAIAILMLTATDPSKIGIQREADDLAALAYVGIAAVLLVIAWVSWWCDFRLTGISQAIDYLAFIVLPSAVEPWGSGYRIAALLIATFIIFETALRWGGRRGVHAAIAINAINAINVIMLLGSPLRFWFHPDPAATDLSILLRNIPFVAAISFLVAWFCMGYERRGAQLLTLGVVRALKESNPQGVLEAVQAQTGARGALICWRSLSAGSCQVTGIGWLADANLDCDSEGRCAALQPPMLFDNRRRRMIALGEDGTLTGAHFEPAEDWLLSRTGECDGVSVPLAGATGSGRLVLVGLPVPGTDMIRQARALGEGMTIEVDRLAFARSARESAEFALRTAVAHELHDGVAQSLAGARFWLSALRHKVEAYPQLRPDLEKVLRALETESAHIREVIEILRRDPDPTRTVALDEAIAAFLPRAAQTWGMTATISGSANGLRVSPAFLFELQQLLREALSNAARHGQASRLSAALHADSTHLTLEITDDGTGFASGNAAPVPRTIGERVVRLGGTVEISSRPGQTRIVLSIPLKGPA